MGMVAKKLILNRLLPKTGQIVSYRGGDDGQSQVGWWKGRDSTNNKIRFISETIGGDDVVIDRATGLIWAADGNAAGCNNGATLIWNEAITCGNALDFAGSFKWRLPNITELLSLVDYGKTTPSIDETFFPNTTTAQYWTSTSEFIDPLFAWYINFDTGFSSYREKTYSYRLRCVRGGL